MLAEFIGMFLFSFFGGGCDANSVSTGLPTAAIGNGLCLAVLVYATAGISGGHLNPAVSTAFFVTGRCVSVPPLCQHMRKHVRLARALCCQNVGVPTFSLRCAC